MTFKRALTPEQEEELVLDWKDGWTVPELSVFYKVSIKTVNRRLAEYGVKYRHRPHKSRKKSRSTGPKELLPCGTNAGYARHRKNGEYPCSECLAAHADDVAKYRTPKPLMPCGTDAAYERHCRHGEPIDEACRLAHNEKKAAQRRARKKAQDGSNQE